MTIAAGVDIGSTYTKAVVADEQGRILGWSLHHTGFRLAEVARRAYDEALSDAGVAAGDVAYVVATGIGRHQAEFKNIHVTDLTAAASGARHLFPDTRTILDVGGQTMKVTRVDESGKVVSFRLNDKCAAGTGAFLEKTAGYMGFKTEEIGPLMATSKEPVTISGVCAVFAESEVINHLSLGAAPADIMQGAVESLVGRCVQLIRRAAGTPGYTLIGGILRFETMGRAVRDQLRHEVNVPEPDVAQFVPALGAALLGHRRLKRAVGSGGVRPPLAG